MTAIADDPVMVPDRELVEDKKPAKSEPPYIRCPLGGWSPRKEDSWLGAQTPSLRLLKSCARKSSVVISVQVSLRVAPAGNRASAKMR